MAEISNWTLWINSTIEQWTWKLNLRLSAIIDKRDSKKIIELEQVLLVKTDANLKVNLKMTSCKNDVEKDDTLYIQMKLADDLIIKSDIKRN